LPILTYEFSLWWLGGVMVRALNSWSRRHGFDSCFDTVRWYTNQHQGQLRFLFLW